MNEMVERVRAAIETHEVAANCNRQGITEWSVRNRTTGEAKAKELDYKVAKAQCDELNARAAIQAMREPTEAMVMAANALPVTKLVDGLVLMTASRSGGSQTNLPAAPNTPLQQWWRAMIDAALAE